MSDLVNLEEERNLLAGLAANDRVAVEKIYKSCYPVISALVTGNNGTSDDAADIFQEGLIVLYEKSLQPDFELSSQIRTFLYAVCRRLWLKRLQSSDRQLISIEDTENTAAVEVDLDQHEVRNKEFAIMESAMAKVGEPCKSLLEAYYLQKKGMKDIADSFGYTNADNAKTQKYKCLVRLKKLFFAQYKNN